MRMMKRKYEKLLRKKRSLRRGWKDYWKKNIDDKFDVSWWKRKKRKRSMR